MVFLGSLAGAGIGLGALASHRQALAVADAAVAADLDEPLDVEGHVAAQVAFHVAVVVDILSQLGRVVLGEVPHADVGVHAGGGLQMSVAVLRPMP